MASFLLGIDSGTTNLKVGVYDPAGNEIALRSHPTPVRTGPDGGAEFEPEAIWRALGSVLAHVPAAILRQVSAVSISSFAETVYPLDAQSRPLAAGLAWYDRRPVRETDELEQMLQEVPVRTITGLDLFWMLSLPKIQWFRHTHPDRYRSVRMWLDNAGYLLMRLGAEPAMTYSFASRTLLFDIWKSEWSQPILGAAGIPPETLPRLVPSGTCVGAVTAEGARATGLPRGARLVSGGHDHLCAALATGVTGSGQILDSTGTSCSVLAALETGGQAATAAARERFCLGRHVVPTAFYLLQGLVTGGYVLDWFVHQLTEFTETPDWTCLFARESDPFFVPYLRGSERGPSSAALVGLRDVHDGRRGLWAAVEAIAFEMRTLVAQLSRIVDTTGWVVRAVGGATKNPALLQAKADVLGRRIEVPAGREAACRGAALLAGVGSDAYADFDEAGRRTLRIGAVYEPDSERCALMERRYRIYRRLVQAYDDFEDRVLSASD